MKATNQHYDSLRADIDEIPVVDTHEHQQRRERTTDILQFLGAWHFMVAGPHYVGHDYVSAVGEERFKPVMDPSIPLEERWPVFEEAYRASRLTGYGTALRYALEKVFGSSDVTLENAKEWAKRIPDYSNEEEFEALIRDAKVVARVSDNFAPINEVVAGTFTALPGQSVTISLPQFHNLRKREQIDRVGNAVGSTITSLGEYEEACHFIFDKWVHVGAVCFKDQSAYERSLAYSLPTQAQAEEIFNTMLANPRASVEWGRDGHLLSDYLMHSFLRKARRMELPVQLHTGHMAGYRNDVTKANAALLQPLLEIHRDVRFDIFHANWPYAGDLLFLGKNYSNVAVNYCWAHQIDPIYSVRMMIQTVSTVPINKVHGVGSDVDGRLPHMVWSHAKLAKDVIASALSELMAMDYLDRDDAMEIARAWIYENPRKFFKLKIPALSA